MALKDFLSLHDDKLHETFARKEYDPSKDRAAMIKRLDTASNQFASATPTKGQKMFKIANGVVALTLPFEVGGKSTFHLPTERFTDAIQHLKDAINKGEADEHLRAGKSSTAGEAAPRAARKPREPREPGAGGGRGWSDERRERFNATVAARKAGS